MNEEIIEALKIIKEPITVNCVEYKYFDEENYNKITNVYQKCLWFANNFEQINLTVENLQKENQQLKQQLHQKEDIINKTINQINHIIQYFDESTQADLILLLTILDNKGE